MAGKAARILVADVEEGNRHLVEAMLLPLGYQVILIGDGEDIVKKASETSPGVILLGSLMPETNGVELIRRLKEDKLTRIVPVVLMANPAETEARARALDAGADDLLAKPVDKLELRARLNSLLKVMAYNEEALNHQKELDIEVSRRTESFKKTLEKLKASSLDTVYRLSRAAEYKDEDTGAHVQRMSHYSTAIARAMKLDDDLVENILWAAPMHDIGKIGIPDRVLQKPAKLDDDEWVIMRSHTTIGFEILKDSDVDFIKLAAEVAISHHEKWNGTGYPRGIKGADTPIAGRIVALADVFDALTSERPYKKPWPLEKALSIIEEGKGTHFDPDAADAFLSIKDEIARELNFWKFMHAEPTAEAPEFDLSGLFP